MGTFILNPYDSPAAWDHIVIGGVDSPGLCVVSGFTRSYEWDVKKGKGTSGGGISFVQLPPAKGSVSFSIFNREHFVEWGLFQELLRYDPTKKGVTAVDIYHPALEVIGIRSVVTESIEALKHDGKGKYSISVNFIEYLPVAKKSSVSTPSSSKSTTKAPGASSDPVADALQAQIKKELDDYNRP